jgi:hypothetical protein
MQVLKGRKGRGWRVLIPRHSTVAAYAALILATGGTAAAATGATFLLGHSNTAKATSGLTNSGKGPALSLKTSSSKYAPLSVSSKALVTNLNANYLDGLPASSFGGTESANVSLPGVDCPVPSTCPTPLFGPVSGASDGTATVASADTLSPGATVLPRDLSVQVTSAPGATEVVVVLVVNDNGSGSTFGCAITGSATTCTDAVSSASIPAGSRISLEILEVVPAMGSIQPENVMTGFILAPA